MIDDGKLDFGAMIAKSQAADLAALARDQSEIRASDADTELAIAAIDRCLQRLRSTKQELDAVLRLLRGPR